MNKNILMALASIFIGTTFSLAWIEVNRLSSRDDALSQDLPGIMRFIVSLARYKRYEDELSKCKERQCKEEKIKRLATFQSSEGSDSPFSSYLRPSEKTKLLVLSQLITVKEECDKLKRPHDDSRCWKNGILGLPHSTLSIFSPEVEQLVASINDEVRKLSQRDDEMAKKRKLEQEERKRLAAQEQQQAAIDGSSRRNIDHFTWLDRWKNHIGRAEIDLDTFETDGVDVVQVHVTVYDENGVPVIPMTRNSYWVFKAECFRDIKFPPYIASNSLKYKYSLGGNFIKNLCNRGGFAMNEEPL